MGNPEPQALIHLLPRWKRSLPELWKCVGMKETSVSPLRPFLFFCAIAASKVGGEHLTTTPPSTLLQKSSPMPGPPSGLCHFGPFFMCLHHAPSRRHSIPWGTGHSESSPNASLISQYFFGQKAGEHWWEIPWQIRFLQHLSALTLLLSRVASSVVSAGTLLESPLRVRWRESIVYCY